MRKCCQCSTATCYFCSLRTKKRGAHCLSHTGSPIIRCAASDTDNKMPTSIVQSCQNQFAHSICSCDSRITLLRRYKWQSCARRHFNHRSAPITHQSKKGLNRFSQRTRHYLLYYFPTRSIDERLYRSLSAIRNRHNFNFCLWIYLSDALCNCRPGFCGCETTFERLWCDEDAHETSSVDN